MIDEQCTHYHRDGARCCRELGHEGTHLFRCSSPTCEGLPYPESERPHVGCGDWDRPTAPAPAAPEDPGLRVQLRLLEQELVRVLDAGAPHLARYSHPEIVRRFCPRAVGADGTLGPRMTYAQASLDLCRALLREAGASQR